MNAKNVVDLLLFCYPERSTLNRPFTQGRYTYATDGAVLIRVPRRADVPENPHAPRKVYRLFSQHRPAGKFRAVPTVDEFRVKIGLASFSASELARLSSLPGVLVAPGATTTNALTFRFDGGDGLLMPLYPDAKNL